MSNNYWLHELSGARRPWPKKDVITRRRQRRARYIVLCYCSVEGPERYNPWVNGERRWRLLDFRQFQKLSQVENSHSSRRLYAPFSHPNHLVVVGRTKDFREYITEYAINE